MTIAIVVGIPEGIVFAADSRQTYSMRRGTQLIPRIGTDFGKKVFQLGPKVGAVTSGWSFLLKRNIKSHVEEFKLNLAQETIVSVSDVAQRLTRFFIEKYKSHVEQGLDIPTPRALMFFVGGYDSKGGSVYRCYVPENEVSLMRNTTTDPGANWTGQIDIISRLLKGVDPRIEQLTNFSKNFRQQLGGLDYIINYNSMTLQDAVDYAIFLIKTTIDMLRFSDGIVMDPGAIPGCGGPIDVAVIQPDGDFYWVQQKKLRGERTTKEYASE